MSQPAVKLSPYDEPVDLIPDEIRRELCQFVLDKATGNFILNIKDGRILGCSMQRYIQLPGR